MPGRYRPPSGAGPEPKEPLQLCRACVSCRVGQTSQARPQLTGERGVAHSLPAMSLWAVRTHPRVLLLSEGETRVCGELAGRTWFPATGRAAGQELLLATGREMPFYLSSCWGKRTALFPSAAGS